MSDLLSMLTSRLGGSALGRIRDELGADEGTASTATAAAMTTLVEALSRNAARPEGAQALAAALEKDHDGSLLDDMASFLGQKNAASGEKILRHVLGERRPRVEAGLARTTGLDPAAVGKLLALLAPVVLAALGRAKREKGLDPGGLAAMLGTERRAIEERRPEIAGLMTGLLDTDGDGDLDASDVARHGMDLLGKLFR